MQCISIRASAPTTVCCDSKLTPKSQDWQLLCFYWEHENTVTGNCSTKDEPSLGRLHKILSRSWFLCSDVKYSITPAVFLVYVSLFMAYLCSKEVVYLFLFWVNVFWSATLIVKWLVICNKIFTCAFKFSIIATSWIRGFRLYLVLPKVTLKHYYIQCSFIFWFS